MSETPKSSFVGLYVENFAGANTQSYKFTLINDKYEGVYEEYHDGSHIKIDLKEVLIDESAGTVSFRKDNKRVTGKFTNSGLDIDDDFLKKKTTHLHDDIQRLSLQQGSSTQRDKPFVTGKEQPGTGYGKEQNQNSRERSRLFY